MTKKLDIHPLKRHCTKRAKKLKKEKGITHSAALELIAQQEGFISWRACLKAIDTMPLKK